jgi:hypothetical protein
MVTPLRDGPMTMVSSWSPWWREVEGGVAEDVPDVLVRDAVLACGCEDLEPHFTKVTCHHIVKSC